MAKQKSDARIAAIRKIEARVEKMKPGDETYYPPQIQVDNHLIKTGSLLKRAGLAPAEQLNYWIKPKTGQKTEAWDGTMAGGRTLDSLEGKPSKDKIIHDLLDALTDLVGGCGKEGNLLSTAAMGKAQAAIKQAAEN